MSASGNPEPSGKNNHKPPKRHWYATEPFWDLKFSHWVEISLTVALVGVGLLQLAVYFRQATIMDTQSQIAATANTQNATENRAFVVPDGIRISGNENGWMAQPIWTNSGNTPAEDMETYTSHCPRVAKLPDNFSYPNLGDGKAGYMFLGPKQSYVGVGDTISPIEADTLSAHMAILYIYGWAKYKDRFSSTDFHWTHYCYAINGFSYDRLKDQGTFNYEPCSKNFCADSECDHRPAPDPADAAMCKGISIQVFAPQWLWNIELRGMMDGFHGTSPVPPDLFSAPICRGKSCSKRHHPSRGA